MNKFEIIIWIKIIIYITFFLIYAYKLKNAELKNKKYYYIFSFFFIFIQAILILSGRGEPINIISIVFLIIVNIFDYMKNRGR